ncbi:ATP-binding cassette subfamily A, member 1 [Novymonas esmeraldas]|uniref:ATP-binding cassette subfamily A, member 1 n=1 Tax=Novymonas esmeraldas TaxID=1808958 RepID=A0AAW0EXW8_9TRYP
MGRRQAQRSVFMDDSRRQIYQRNVQIADNTRLHSVASTRGPMTGHAAGGAAAQPLARSRRDADEDEHLDIEPNEKGGTFNDQFLATIERTIQQKQRAWLGTLLELLIPLLFVIGSIILWAAFGDDKYAQKQELNYSTVSSVTLPDFYTFVTCNNVSMGTFPGLSPCDTAGYPYDCSGDESSLPLKGMCFNKTTGGAGLIGLYMNAILGNAVRVPPLDTIIMMQWIARKSLISNSDSASSLTLAAAGLIDSTRYNAIMNSGLLYFAPAASVPASLIKYMNDTTQYFRYIYGGTFDTVADAENHVKTTPGFHWGIVEVNAFNSTNFDVVLHMNSTALPSLTKVVDIQYPGGFHFDRGEMYTASGFNSLQEIIYQCYLQEIGYTAGSSIHAYSTALGYQAYTDKMLLNTAAPLVAFILVLAFLYPVAQLTKKIVLEKELRIREAMLIMGLSNTSLYLSWFVTYALQYLVECIVIVILLKVTFVPSSDAFVLFLTFYLFALSTIPLSGLIAAFFSKARLASMLAPLIFFALSVPTFAFTSASANVIIGVSVLSPTAFASALTNILTLEVGTGFGSQDFRNPALSPQSYILYALLAADFVAYYIFMLYFDAVLPKDWGTTKHPLFFIIDPVKALCCCCCEKKNSLTGDNEDGRAEDGVFEDADDSDATVQIVGLRREYKRGGKTFAAVNNLYWSMNEKEISVLLGHNGAGKTTTMNMMTGMTTPDEGDCYINGYSVRTQLDRVRQQIGFCPQHNILWPELTCREHLEYYGKIKGLFGPVLEDAVRLILKEVDLLNKIEYPSSALSGGQKRKLSVAIAFVGRSPLIFLDEPTAGMDVGARRYTWELLRRMSEAHTIMLTTHYMDEADLLGQKIGIMSRGRMQCSGSSMFLKSRLGVGYNMSISIDPDAEAEDIDQLVVSFVPSAVASSFNGCEIVYKLPMRDVEKFPALLAGLEESGEEAGVRGYSLSATTLEEVFLQIALDDMKHHKASSDAEQDAEALQDEDHAVWSCELMTGTRERLLSQFRAMMAKRLWNALRDRKMQCFQVVCPVVCILLAMLLTLVSFTKTGSINLSSTMFGETVDMLVSGCEPYIGSVDNSTRQGAHIIDLNFASGLDLSYYGTDTAKELTTPRYTSLFCNDPGLAAIVPGELTATFLFYNTSAYHSGGIVLNQLYSFVLQSFTGNVNRTLNMGAAPMPATTGDTGVRGGVQTILIGAIVMIPFTFLPSNPVAWIVKERECKARHLQNVSGLSFYIYWASTFLFDIAAYIITLILVLVIFAIFSRKEYVGADTAGPTIVMFLVYGFCSTVGAYVVSFAFDEHSTAQSVTMAVSFVTGFLLVMMVFILSLVDATKDASKKLRWPFRLVPSYCVGESIINLAMDRQQAVLQQPSNPWGMDVVGWPCVFMAIEFPLFLLATLFIDHPRRRMWGQKGSYDRSAPAEVIDGEDSDVEDERKEVYIQEERAVNDDVVRVVDLRKVYTNGKVAVRNLAFSILPDEVFGFLGTNGAGKTTAISMLCQEFIPSSGNAYVCGYDIVKNSVEALQCIGYCPQFDATLDLLTVEEHLYLYAGIRGIVLEQRPKVVRGLLRLCDIAEYRTTTSAQLSGGNRRKLSVALSLIGSPQVVFLDEPSAGMDPVARRGLWTAIQKVSQNCSVVLTTHHLEEVEELADTVAIMADGALRCIGDKIHLKQKYGSGFEMSIRIASKEMRAAVQKFVEKSFPTATLNEFKGQRFVFALPQDTKLSETFWQLQQNKERLQITDYSVSQTSIEQVFLRISEQQEEREELGEEEKVVRFVKSHATVHNYRGNATARRRGSGDDDAPAGKSRRRAPVETTVSVSSAAMEAYRRKKMEAGITDKETRSARSSASSSDEEEEDNSDDDVTDMRSASSRRPPPGRSGSTGGGALEMGSMSSMHGSTSVRHRNTGRPASSRAPEPSAGYVNPYNNAYGGAEGQSYGYGQDYGASSGYVDPHQHGGQGGGGSNNYGYGGYGGYDNGGNDAAAGQAPQSQNPYDSYYGGDYKKYN